MQCDKLHPVTQRRPDATSEAFPNAIPLERVADHLPVLVSYVDRDYRYRFVNRAYESWYGTSRDQIVGRTIDEMLGTENAAKIRPRMDVALAGSDVHEEIRISRNGRDHWMRTRYVPDQRDGRVEGFIALVEDVTEEHLAREKLRDSDERYRMFIAQTNEAIWRFEINEPIPVTLSEPELIERMFAGGYLAECNDAMAKMYGFGHAADIVGTPLAQLMDPAADGNHRYLQSFIRNGFRLDDAESVERDREGNVKYFRNSLTGIVIDGALHRAWGTQRDVTVERLREESVRQSEARFRDVANTIPAIVWRTDRNGKCTFLNNAWKELSGRDVTFGLGDGWREQFHPEDLIRTDAESAIAIEQLAPFTIEYRFRMHDGSYRWMLDNGIPQFAGDGSFDGYIGTSVDIHERKIAEQELTLVSQILEQSQRRLDNTIRTIPGVVWETAGGPSTERKLTFVSEHIQVLLGYSVAEWYREPDFWQKIIPPDDYEGMMQRMRERAARLEDETVDRVRMRRKDGRVIWTEVRSRIIRSESGEVTGIRGLTLDVTQDVRSQERARLIARVSTVVGESLDYEAGFEALAKVIVEEFADCCVIDVAEDREVVRAAIASRIPLGSEIESLLRNDFLPSAGGEVTSVIESGDGVLHTTLSEETRARIAGNEQLARLVEGIGTRSYMIVPLRLGQTVTGAMTIISSRAERLYDGLDFATASEFADRASLLLERARLYRQAQRANQLKDEFLATLSHELRTPMTATLGWASLLSDRSLPIDTVRIGIEAIEQSTRAQAKLVDDILDVSRIVTGKMSLTLAPTNLWEVLQVAFDTVRGAADAKAIQLSLRNEAGTAIVAGDASRLQQIIWNLLSNAVKFTPSGGSIEVELRPREDRYLLAVRDSGVGIDPDFLPHVFERFRQADSSAARRHGGLGLGLSIARNLAELHGGTIAALSEGEGKGSTFTLEIPVANPSVLTARVDPRIRPDLNGVTIVVVDDDEATRKMLGTALRSYGASVEAVSSPRIALQVIANEHADIVVSDIGMPHEDGYDLLSSIRGGVRKELPVIALTAYASEVDRSRIDAEGFDAFLSKPVDPEHLAREIQRVIASVRAR